mgnify:CR=1 FL=1
MGRTSIINKPTVGGYSDGKEKTMRYKNYILSKGDKVKLKPYSDDWSPGMTKKYGGKTVTIKDFPKFNGFECEPLGIDIAGYLFSYDDIDEVVYCKLREKKINKIKPYEKILYIEGESVDPRFLQTLRAANPEIFIIIYRKGSAQPKLVDMRSMRNEKHIY